MTQVLSRTILGIVRIYQIVGRDLLLSFVPVRCSCKFHPSCSEYCEEAVHAFGPLRGSWYGICRVMRCFFWSRSRYDMV